MGHDTPVAPWALRSRCAGRPASAPRGRACTPANLSRLPAEAWADLRRVHAGVGVTLGVPDPGLVVPQLVPYSRPEEGTLPHWHPAHGIYGEPGHGTDCTNGGARGGEQGQAIPLCPVVAAYGRAVLHAGLEAWWDRWKRRNGAPQGHAAELVLAGRAVESHVPSSGLRDWLRGMGWDGEALTPAEGVQWMDVWQQQQRALRAACLPRRVGGVGTRPDPPGRACITGRYLFGRKHKGTLRVLDEEGRLCSNGWEAEAALWKGWAPIWGVQPAMTGAAGPLLRTYFNFRGRAARVGGGGPSHVGENCGACSTCRGQCGRCRRQALRAVPSLPCGSELPDRAGGPRQRARCLGGQTRDWRRSGPSDLGPQATGQARGDQPSG